MGRISVLLVLLGVVVVLAFGLLAPLVASRLPAPLSTAPVDEVVTMLSQTRIRAVPVGLPAGTQIRTVADVRPFAVQAVGPDVADLLLSLLDAPNDEVPGVSPEWFSWAYPYRFPGVDDALSTVPQDQLSEHGAAFGAALLLLAAPEYSSQSESATRIAFGVLDHARSGGACDPQLNLLTLVAADPYSVPEDDIDVEAAKAQQVCPGDPTPGWLRVRRALGIVTMFGGASSGKDGVDAFHVARTIAEDLVAAFPDDPGVLTTLGDVHLTAGQALAAPQPFTSRRAFRDAEAIFTRILQGPESADARLGLARARLGLGDPESAAGLAQTVAEASVNPGRALQLAISAEEKAHRYADASSLALRLVDVGVEAFPSRTAVMPLGPPLSFGTDRLTPVTWHLLLPQGDVGGGLTMDEGFIPLYREVDDLTATAEHCPEFVGRRAALLAGDAAGAAEGWPDTFASVDELAGSCPSGERLRRQVDSWLNGPPSAVDDPAIRADVETLFDDRQNLLRWAGDLTGARRETLAWMHLLGDKTALAHQRLGEIEYLREDFHAASAALAEAAMRSRLLNQGNDLAVFNIQLTQGAALRRAERGDEAAVVLRPLVLAGARGYAYQSQQSGSWSEGAQGFALVSYYAATLLADHELAIGQPQAAAEDLAAALLWSDTLRGKVHLDVARNSAAVAYLEVGDTERAVQMSEAAVAGDPISPINLMTAAAVAHRDGDVELAIERYRAALESDPSLFPVANNLGVRLADQGRAAQASLVLRSAVDANPDYALGWHNLGVVEGRRGPAHVLASQGALARALALDPGLADQPPRLRMDDTTYRTSLDVSKPLPEGWTFVASQRKAPAATMGALALTLIGAGLLRIRAAKVDSDDAEDWLNGLKSHRRRFHAAIWTRPRWAVLATAGTFLLAFWRQPLWPWTGITYALCLLVLIAAGMLSRAVIAQRQASRLAQGTWWPILVVGLVSGAIGSPLAPMPAVRTPANDSRVAMAAPVTLAVLSAVLLLESVFLHVPLTTSLCLASFIMAGSLLIPVQPLDGARAGAAGAVAAAGLLGAAVLLMLGLA